MKLVLATSKTCGLCHMLRSKLKKENLESTICVLQDDMNFFEKHKIKSLPRLLVFEDDELTEIVQGVDDIISKVKYNN
jgi:hypothetical protein